MPVFGPPVAGQWTALAAFRAATTSRACTLTISWYQASGAPSAITPTSTSASVNDTTTGWVIASLTVIAPSDAVYASLGVAVAGCAASEVHYCDSRLLAPGDITVWTAGGFVGVTAAIITRSDDLEVRFASTANPAPIPVPSQTLVVYDYEAVPSVAYTYSAAVTALLAGLSTTGPPDESTPVTLTTDQWWELDPTNPSTAVNAQPITWQPVQTEQSTAHLVMGQNVLNVVASNILLQDFTGTMEVFATAVYAALNALVISQVTVFISSPWGAIETGYYRIGPTSGGGGGSGSGTQVKQGSLLPSTANAAHRTLDLQAVAQTRPLV